MLGVTTEESFRWITCLSGSSNWFALCAVAEAKGRSRPAQANPAIAAPGRKSAVQNKNKRAGLRRPPLHRESGFRGFESSRWLFFRRLFCFPRAATQIRDAQGLKPLRGQPVDVGANVWATARARGIVPLREKAASSRRTPRRRLEAGGTKWQRPDRVGINAVASTKAGN